MTTKAQAKKVLQRYGFVIDEEVSGKIGMGWTCTFDPPAGMSIAGDCRGSVEHDYTSASGLWESVIERAHEEGPLLEPCPNPEHCEFHSDEGDE